MINEKEWTKIFKGFGNENRLKIIKILYPHREFSVSEVRRKLGISYKWTSKNLVDLEKIGILRSRGTKGQVFYSVNPKLSPKIKKIIKEFLT